MWPDRETEIDYLNFSETASVAAGVIADDKMLPVSVGIFGGWGTGKSSLLRLTRKELEKLLKDGPRLVVVEFDAWLFQGYDDARAALMQTIGNRLLMEAAEKEGLKAKAIALLKRVDYLRSLGLAVDVGAAVMLGVPTAGLFGRAFAGLGKVMSGQGEAEDVQAIKDDVAKGAAKVEGIVRPKATASPPDEILAFRRELGELLDGLDIRLVVTIDNLDRCMPIATIQTLEAVRLFLFLPRTAFIVAADEEMIRSAVSQYYREAGRKHKVEYVDKLIQVPVPVPLLGLQEVRAYMMLLFAAASPLTEEKIEALRVAFAKALRESWKGSRITRDLVNATIGEIPPDLGRQLDLADRLAPILTTAPNVSANPRTIKRLMTALSMRMSLARKHGIVVDEAVVAKLAVLERVSGDAYRYLVNLVSDAANGAPPILKQLEDAQPGTQEFRDLVPKDWTGAGDFLEDWFALDPDLGGRDLRGAVYLTREGKGLVHAAGELSARASTAFKALAAVASTTSKAAPAIIQSLPPVEHSDVMNALIGLMREASNWNERPEGLAGALVLADASGPAAERLVEFLVSIPPNAVGPWIGPLLQNREWAVAAEAHFKAGASGQREVLKGLGLRRKE